mgnify:CR=1 FL=1
MSEFEFSALPKSNIERRSVLKAAAWAAPVVAMAAAAPLAAASVPPKPKRYFTVGFTMNREEEEENGIKVSKNINLVEGTFELQGAAGDSAGTPYIRIDVPVGYNWVPNGDMGAFSVVGPTTLEDGRTRYRYTAVTEMKIPAGANETFLLFPGGVMVGSGATTTNRASLVVATDQHDGNGDPESIS